MLKYSNSGSVVQVACITIEGEIKLRIKDQSIGIEQSETPKILDGFYRVKGNHLISRFGIGLYVSSEIVKLHNGALWAESEIGKGSVFTFAIPIDSNLIYILDEKMQVTFYK